MAIRWMRLKPREESVVRDAVVRDISKNKNTFNNNKPLKRAIFCFLGIRKMCF